MLKKIGISVAALCAAIVFVKPPAAAAADRDDYNNRPSYRYSEGRDANHSNQGYQPYGYRQRRNEHEWYKTQERFRNKYEQNRRSRVWRDDEDDQGQRWNNRDRNGYNPYQR